MGKIVDLDGERRPGRPPKVNRRPTSFQEARLAEQSANLEDFCKRDVTIAASLPGAPKLEALYVTRLEMAREAASLLWIRLHTPVTHREYGRIASRRIAALTEVMRLTLEIHRALPDVPSPQRLTRIMLALRQEVHAAAQALFDPGTVARFEAELERRTQKGPI